MVLDAMRIYWQDPYATRNGRRGQRQCGVDIVGTGRTELVGAQAKNSETISESVVLREVTEAERFVPELKGYSLVVAGPRDARLLEFVRVLSCERAAGGRFRVEVLFFEDVCHELASSPGLMRKYWAEFISDIESVQRALPQALSDRVMDADSAATRVMDTPEFEAFASMLDKASGGTVNAHVRVSAGPRLDAAPGTPERAWLVSIGERHEEHVAMLSHVAVDFDSGAILLYDFATETWRRREDIKDPVDAVFHHDGVSTLGADPMRPERSDAVSCLTIEERVTNSSIDGDIAQVQPKRGHVVLPSDIGAESACTELATIGEDARGVVFTIGSSSLFAPGDTALTPSGVRLLERLAELMGKLTNAATMTVESHTDAIGSHAANDNLSQARATSVRAHLVTTGVHADSIAAVGKGKTSPRDDNSTPEGRARNRRIEITVR
jgi:outer membrane protein OmpA-like peptidoglycan-associated protein